MATFDVVPLLLAQRGLLHLPRDMTRFRAYLQLLTEGRNDAVRPPLVAFNPMAREHVAERLDALLSLDAEGVAAAALRAVEGRRPEFAPADALRVGLVVIDDLKGGWTNRAATELFLRFEPGHALRQGWITVPFWSSEEPTSERVRRETIGMAFRAWWHRAGLPARTLRERLTLETRVARFAGLSADLIEADELAYNREVLAPLMEATDAPTHVAALFGDRAARALGMPALGLSEGAGLAVAAHDALAVVG